MPNNQTGPSLLDRHDTSKPPTRNNKWGGAGGVRGGRVLALRVGVTMGKKKGKSKKGKKSGKGAKGKMSFPPTFTAAVGKGVFA